jgi:hypothetical protein
VKDLPSSLRLVLCRVFQELGVIPELQDKRRADDDDIPIKGTEPRDGTLSCRQRPDG